MNDYELNGRRIRVNFSNSSHLEVLAGNLGMDLSQQTQRSSSKVNNNELTTSVGTDAVSDALKAMSKGEMYDVVAKLKEIADRDPDEARRILSGHPQLPEAVLFLMSKLDMVQTSVPIAGGGAVLSSMGVPAPPRAADPRALKDPRAAAAVVDPRAVGVAPPPPPRADPRARADPRVRVAPPPMVQPSYIAPPPPAGLPPPPPPSVVSNLDPALIQQVMSLTPQQIAQLPPDKQQSILALRQQIQGGR
jgi:cleavage stimulation factor subunit 2